MTAPDAAGIEAALAAGLAAHWPALWEEWRGSDGDSPDDHYMQLARDAAPWRIVMLLPANRVEQAWWQDHVEPYRDRPGSPLRVEFLRGRMRFDRPGWTKPTKGDRPPFGCCLLIWGGTR